MRRLDVKRNYRCPKEPRMSRKPNWLQIGAPRLAASAVGHQPGQALFRIFWAAMRHSSRARAAISLNLTAGVGVQYHEGYERRTAHDARARRRARPFRGKSMLRGPESRKPTLWGLKAHGLS